MRSPWAASSTAWRIIVRKDESDKRRTISAELYNMHNLSNICVSYEAYMLYNLCMTY